MLDSVEVTMFKKSQEVYSQTEIIFFGPDLGALQIVDQLFMDILEVG